MRKEGNVGQWGMLQQVKVQHMRITDFCCFRWSKSLNTNKTNCPPWLCLTQNPAEQSPVSHFILAYKRLQQWRAGPIPTRICRTVQHTLLCCGGWISLQAHTAGCWGHRDLLGNSPHYKPHPLNAVKVYDIIRPCHRRALQSERECTLQRPRGQSRRWFTPFF